MPHNPLRFATFIRVSTDKQAQQGESLRTQTKQTDQAAETLDAEITVRYSGQEHATAGWEREIFNRLLADARKSPRPFDAVMVADPSRWSRDNLKSEEGLEILKEYGIRFFVLTQEYDLTDPQQRLYLGLHTQINAFQAAMQNQKSLLNRIERAKRNSPSSGKLPFGRLFDRANQSWSVDVAKVKLIEDVARRYLAGESLPKLAREFQMNHKNLHTILKEKCGPIWRVEFHAANVHETVELNVPQLLPETTIRKVLNRMEANRTYRHGQPRKNHYLFTGMVFCGYCGYTLSGQRNKDGHLYYRHSNKLRCRECPMRPRPYIRADRLEDTVIRHLFETFGNPEAVRRAVELAIPNREVVKEHQEKLARLEVDQKKIEKARSQILDQIVKGNITDAHAERQLAELKCRDSTLQAHRMQLEEMLSSSPSNEEIRLLIENVARRVSQGLPPYPVSAKRHLAVKKANSDFGAMTWAERRALAEAVFSGRTSDGKAMGIYVFAAEGQEVRRQKMWKFEMRGDARIDGYIVTRPPIVAPEDDAVTQCGKDSPAPALPARRFCGRSPRSSA